jgi:hypothetical protein
MAKKIKFATRHEFIDLPKSAAQSIPEWYKLSPRTNDGKKLQISKEGNVNSAIKMCIPFLDSMTSGYTVHTWQDIQVNSEDGVSGASWKIKPDILGIRDRSFSGHLPVPAGHNSANFYWIAEFVFQTPPGYSVLVTHPFNRFDLPFTTLSAVVDSDGTLHEGGVPFFMKEGFEGIIPAGTPMFQILPFKRENWESEEDPSIIKIADRNIFKSGSAIGGWYKKNIWKRKTYK